MTGNLIEYPRFDPSHLLPSAGNPGAEWADDRSSYEAPRMIELTRSFVMTICGEAGCVPESPQWVGGAS